MKKQFLDSEGRAWEVKFTLRVLRKIAERTGLTLDVLEQLAGSQDGSGEQSIPAVPLSYLFEAVWCVVEKQASKRDLNRDEFEDSMGMSELKSAAGVMMNALVADFPQAEGGDADPLDSEAAGVENLGV